jgi:hypothetical protein
MKLRDYFLFIATGIALHQTASITGKIPHGWERLTAYVIGVEGTFPVFVLLMNRLGLPQDAIIRAGAAFQLAFLLIGIGVAAGWLFDTLFGIDRTA